MKKGFTLIELLAVIVILAIIAVIAIPIVLNVVNDAENSSIFRSAEFYLDALEQSVVKHQLKNDKFDDGSYDILENGNLCLKYNTSNVCVNELKVEVKGDKPTSGNIDIVNGEIKNSIINLSNKTLVSINNSNLIEQPCVHISGEEKQIGSRYSCEVTDGITYTFYVLSHNNDGTTNLIMERNIYYNSDTDRGRSTAEKTGNVNWASQEDYNDDVNYGTSGNNNKGPITAMKYLYSATKHWDNIPYMIIDYEDEGNTGNYGYGGIKTEGKTTRITMKDGTVTATIENLKARLPKASEVSGEGLCGLYVKYSCPIWLNDYLGAIYKEEYENKGTRIAGIEGFWTLSSRVDSPSWAMRVLHEGRYAYSEVNSEIRAGIRPVITIKL